jgi:periplasmic protein TonB
LTVALSTLLGSSNEDAPHGAQVAESAMATTAAFLPVALPQPEPALLRSLQWQQPSRARRPVAVMLSMLAHVGVLTLCALGSLHGSHPATEPPPVKVSLSAWRPASRPKPPQPAKVTPRRPTPKPPVVQPQAIVQPPPPPEAQAEPEPEEPEVEGDPNGTVEPEAVAEAPPDGSPFGTANDPALELRQVARAPAVRESPTPDYPRQARNERIEGRVVLRVVIDREGRVEPAGIKVVRSVPALDAAAIAAVQRWRFSPALDHQGRLVRVVVEIPFEFSLH